MSEFSKYISRLRMENGYKTKTDFANATGISMATISRIESGIHHPSTNTLKTMSEHLYTVTYQELLKAAGYLEETEEQESKYDPEAEELMRMLYTLPKEKREEYIELMKKMIEITKPHS